MDQTEYDFRIKQLCLIGELLEGFDLVSLFMFNNAKNITGQVSVVSEPVDDRLISNALSFYNIYRGSSRKIKL